MGANQEGARIITTQSKAEENHYKLYDRWVIDCTDQSVHLNQHSFSSQFCVRACLCVCLYTCALRVTHKFKFDTQGQQTSAALQAVQWERQNTILTL